MNEILHEEEVGRPFLMGSLRDEGRIGELFHERYLLRVL